MLDRITDFRDDARPLRELERRTQPPDLETLDLLHHAQSRIARAELEEADDAAVGEEGHGARFVQELRQAGAATVATNDLSGDDSIELQIPELVHLAHAAGADALDRLEPLEARQRIRHVKHR